MGAPVQVMVHVGGAAAALSRLRRNANLKLAVALADPPATLPLLAGPWNAGFVDMAGITEDFTKSEVPQRQGTFVPDIEKVSLQGSCSQVQCSRRVCLGDGLQR